MLDFPSDATILFLCCLGINAKEVTTVSAVNAVSLTIICMFGGKTADLPRLNDLSRLERFSKYLRGGLEPRDQKVRSNEKLFFSFFNFVIWVNLQRIVVSLEGSECYNN